MINALVAPNIRSTLLIPAVREHPFPIFDTRVERDGEALKLIAIAILGSVQDRRISHQAQECLDQFVGVQKTAYPNSKVYLVEMISLWTVDQEIDDVLQKVADGDAIAYVCLSAAIFKRVLTVLGLTPPREGTH